jgi:hypothetical protein
MALQKRRDVKRSNLTVDEILSTTSGHPKSNITKNSKSVNLRWKEPVYYEDRNGEEFKEIQVQARDKTIKRDVVVRYWLDYDDPYVWVSCSCEWFLFNCEYALQRRKYQASEIKYSNGKKPKPEKQGGKNSRMLPYACKHIIKILRLGVGRQKASKKGTRLYKNKPKKSTLKQTKYKPSRARQRREARQRR